MLFSSLSFLFFIPGWIAASSLILWLGSKTGRRFLSQCANLILIGASLFFYWWGTDTETVIRLLRFSGVVYALGLGIRFSPTLIVARIFTVIGVIFSTGYLITLKLGNLIAEVISSVSVSFEDLAMLGVSFVVFHAISYHVDLYRDINTGKKRVIPYATNPINCFLYILFFPKVLQGPIVQFADFAPQLISRVITREYLFEGIALFSFGLIKKVMFADTIARLAGGYNPYDLSIQAAWLYLFLYTMRLYLDFSGYSDMAIGLSRMCGFDIKANFNFPYISRSITEFWRRWHISLGAFFRNYVYIPLGGSRTGNVYINIMIVFLISGVWHEAQIMYLAWGALHGVCSCIERFLMKKGLYNKIPAIFQWAYCFLIINVGWIVFLMQTPENCKAMVLSLLGQTGQTPTILLEKMLTPELIFVIGVSLLFSFICGLSWVTQLVDRVKQKTWFIALKGVSALICLYLGYMYLVNSSFSPFLYFQY